MNGRLKDKFVSRNAVNLSKQKLSNSEISILPKGLEFILTSNTVDKAKHEIKFEAFGRMVRLKWFFGSSHPKKTSVPVSFLIKLQAWPATLLKKRDSGVFTGDFL